jgi:hypothetical protein
LPSGNTALAAGSRLRSHGSGSRSPSIGLADAVFSGGSGESTSCVDRNSRESWPAMVPPLALKSVMLMQTNAFYPSLNDFCRKYFIIGQTPLTALDVAMQQPRANAEGAALFEHLLLFDHVSLKVYGENIPLAFLFEQFGAKGLESLLEQEAVKFVFFSSMIGHFISDAPGVDPLVSADHNAPVLSDPETSIDLGLAWLKEKLPKYVLKTLKRKALPLYVMPPKGFAAETVAATNSAFHAGKLKRFNLDPEKQDYRNLKLTERERVGHCAGQLFEYRFLLSSGMTSMSSFDYLSLFSESLERIEKSGRITAGFNQLAKIEDMPNLQALFLTLPDGLARLPKLRKTRTARNFRQWLSTATSGDKNLTDEYLAAIADRKGPLDFPAGKLTKVITLVAAGLAIGQVVEGPVGALLGSVAGAVADKAADFGLGLLDGSCWMACSRDGIRACSSMMFGVYRRKMTPAHNSGTAELEEKLCVAGKSAFWRMRGTLIVNPHMEAGCGAVSAKKELRCV